MKNSLLLLMTPNMTLEKWNELGQLSRELDYYLALCKSANLQLIIYSYGRNDSKFIKKNPDVQVLEMPQWIPSTIPFKLQNLIYNLCSLIIYRSVFKKVILAKTNQYSASRFGILLRLVLRIPLIIRMGYYHSHFKKISLFSRIGEWLAFNYCDLILTTSSEASAFIMSQYNVPARKILAMCNTINLDVFKPANAVKEYDLIFVGRLEKVKNIDLMLAVIQELKLKTIIIGRGPLAHLVKASIKTNPWIVWKERIDNIDLPDYYNKAKCCILFSQYEGNPKALLEAMACGIPGIGTNVYGIRDCIIPDDNGILAEPDFSSLKNSIHDLFLDDFKMEKMGDNAAKWAIYHCDMTKNIEKELSFYSNFLNKDFPVYSNLNLK